MPQTMLLLTGRPEIKMFDLDELREVLDQNGYVVVPRERIRVVRYAARTSESEVLRWADPRVVAEYCAASARRMVLSTLADAVTVSISDDGLTYEASATVLLPSPRKTGS